MNHVQQSSTQESPSIVILGAREWKMELLAIWQGDLSGVRFALSEMEVEGAGGGFYRRAEVFGCGVVVMEQVPRGSRCDKGERGGLVLPATMVAVGALQRGRGRR
jgi:hypothetical protein